MKKLLIQLVGAATALGLAQVAAGQGVLHVLVPAPGVQASMGRSVSAAGDVNGDGYPDVVVSGGAGATPPGSPSGPVTVFSGRDGQGLLGFPGNPGDYFGWSVSGAGDVDGDGVTDILVGAPCLQGPATLGGYAQLFSGASGSVLHTWYGTSMHDSFGVSVSSAGDFNSDGFPDVLVGANQDDNGGLVDAGSAQVFSFQGGLLYTFYGHVALARFGTSVSDAGDVNNDGFPDIVVGADFDSGGGYGAGSVEVFSGQNGASLYRFLGPVSGKLGLCVSDAGDVDADGFADVVVGGLQVASLSYYYAKVYSGKNGVVIHTFGQPGEAEGGDAVCGAGDADQDGFSDLALHVWSPEGIIGRSGKDGSELFHLEGETATDHYGRSVSSAGDVNHDGIPEIIVGSPLGTPTSYAHVVSTRCGTITAVGQGCPGSAAAPPSLTIQGCAVPGGTLLVSVYAGSLVTTPVLLLVGPATTSLPMGGGCSLLVAPPHTPAWVVTSWFGVFSAYAEIPMATALGTLAVQAFIPDPAAPAGFRNTNAVLIDVE